jgi:hypothetical protein
MLPETLRSGWVNICARELRFQRTKRIDSLPHYVEWDYSPYTGRFGVLLSISVAVVVPKTSSALRAAPVPLEALLLSGLFPVG